MPTLKETMLNPNEMRSYIIEKAKAPMRKLIVKASTRFPNPTRCNCHNPLSLKLFDIWDEFNERDRSGAERKDMFNAAWKMLIIEVEHDVYYRDRLIWVLGRLLRSGYRFEGREPMTHWDWEIPLDIKEMNLHKTLIELKGGL